jgi:hypothetical protein
VDAIKHVELLDEAAIEVPAEELNAIFRAGYGIFSGRDVTWAKLRFTPYQARWIATEKWHVEQRGHFEADGSYILEFPFASSTEIGDGHPAVRPKRRSHLSARTARHGD